MENKKQMHTHLPFMQQQFITTKDQFILLMYHNEDIFFSVINYYNGR